MDILSFILIGSGRRSMLNTEGKAKVVAAGWGTYLQAALSIYQQVRFEEKFLGEQSLKEGGGFVWCKPTYHPFCIYSAM